MRAKFSKLPLKTGVLSIVVAQSVILCLIAIILIKFLSYRYTNLVINESSEILNQYSEKVENSLKQTEKLSYDILCTREIENNMLLYQQSESIYTRYLATTDLYNQLFSRTFSQPCVVSADFIFNDSTRVDVRIISVNGQTRDYMDYLYKNAVLADGNSIWTVNPNNPNIISCSRLIKDVSGSNGFIPLGVLVINLDAEKLLTYDSVSSEKYKSDIICYADGNILSYKGSKVTNNDISSIVRQNKKSGEVVLDKTKYLFSVNSTNTANWQFISLLKSDNLLSDISRIQTWYLICFILVVLFIFILAIKFADMICHPVASLSHSMKRVKEDIFEIHPPTDNNQVQIEEIVQLTDSYNTMITKIDYLINEEYKKQLMISDMHYKILQNQINPHFLYNTLETIHWKAEECGNKDISVMILAVSNLLRSSVSKIDINTVEDDLRLVRDYISIQQMRFEERLIFEMEPDPSLFACKIPKMTLQPIVENSIRHNLEKHLCICRISISFQKHKDSFSILICDNGKNADIDHINRVMQGLEEGEGTGLGLKNIHERIQICFGGDYGLQIYLDQEKGLCTEILLPYKMD